MKKIFKNVNPTKFVDELISKGIKIIEAFYEEEEKVTSITFTDNVDLDLVNILYEKHSPSIEVKLTVEEKIEVLENENADLLLDSVMKDIIIEQSELDIADLLLTMGGM